MSGEWISDAAERSSSQSCNPHVDEAQESPREPLEAPEIEALAEQLYEILPSDGTGRGNASLRREMRLPSEQYWSVRNYLIDQGRAISGRGRGGSTSRTVEIAPSGPQEHEAAQISQAFQERLREDSLYTPIRRVLEGDWQADKGIDYLMVEETAKAGSKRTGGKWTRPDLVAVAVEVFTYLPAKVMSVHTFEVKSADSVDVTAVYEALAHRRAATHAYVVLHVPDPDQKQTGVAEVVSEARRHGVGVIEFSDPGNYETWEETVTADRVEPEPSALNDFIRVQLPDAARRQIERAIR